MIQNIRVVRKIGDVKINTAIVVIVTNSYAHARLLATVLVQGNAGRVTDFFKSAITFVQVEKLRCGIVHDQQIE